MPIRAVLFDLDGTLLDTLADIGGAANAVLVREGFPTHPLDSYRQFIGEGVAMLFRRALPQGAVDPGQVERCVEGFREEYARRWNDQTRLYDGVAELLDDLTARSIRLAVLSNKPDAFTRKCVETYLSEWPFEAVFGERQGVPRKPDPTSAREIAERLGVPPGEFLYVGDTTIDMQTAIRAGMRPVGAGWGFRPAEELWAAGASRVVDHPLQVRELFGEG